MNATDELLKTARSYEPMQVFSLIAELTKIAFHNRVFGSTFPLRDSTGSVVGYLTPPVHPDSISATSWNEPEEVMQTVVHGYANTEGSTDFADVMNRLRSTTHPTSSSTPSLS